MARFVKVRFMSDVGATAGLVFTEAQMRMCSVSQLSRYFPSSEFRKMRTLQISRPYMSWEEAFDHEFGSNGQSADLPVFKVCR